MEISRANRKKSFERSTNESSKSQNKSIKNGKKLNSLLSLYFTLLLPTSFIYILSLQVLFHSQTVMHRSFFSWRKSHTQKVQIIEKSLYIFDKFIQLQRNRRAFQFYQADILNFIIEGNQLFYYLIVKKKDGTFLNKKKSILFQYCEFRNIFLNNLAIPKLITHDLNEFDLKINFSQIQEL